MEASHDSRPYQGSAMEQAVKDIAFGSIAGMVSEVFEYPFDLAKVRLQSQVLDPTARFTGPWDCLLQTYKGEGIAGLYRGLPVPLIGGMAESAALFLAYGSFQNMVRAFSGRSSGEELSLSQLGVAAAGAGFLTSFIMTPIELVKCKMQVQMLAPPRRATTTVSPLQLSPGLLPISLTKSIHTQSHQFPGPLQIVSSIVRASGIRGLWVGQVGTALRETGGTAMWFVLKEAFASSLLKMRAVHPSKSRDLTPWESALSGAVAGGICAAAFYPIDTVKSAIQTADEMQPPKAMGRPSPARLSFTATTRAMWRARGMAGLYAGCGMTTLRAFPSSGIIFVVYDGLTQYFGAPILVSL